MEQDKTVVSHSIRVQCPGCDSIVEVFVTEGDKDQEMMTCICPVPVCGEEFEVPTYRAFRKDEP